MQIETIWVNRSDGLTLWSCSWLWRSEIFMPLLNQPFSRRICIRNKTRTFDSLIMFKMWKLKIFFVEKFWLELNLSQRFVKNFEISFMYKNNINSYTVSCFCNFISMYSHRVKHVEVSTSCDLVEAEEERLLYSDFLEILATVLFWMWRRFG